jgi:hypothetical protein
VGLRRAQSSRFAKEGLFSESCLPNERAVAHLATALLDVITWIRPGGATQTASVRCEGPIHHHGHAANGANDGDIAGTGTDYRSNSNGDSSHHNTEDVARNKQVP